MFADARDDETIHNLFVNIFDAEVHQDNQFVHETLPQLFKSLQDGSAEMENGGIFAVDQNGKRSSDAVLTLQYILRLYKFFIEKGGDRK